VSSNQRLNKTLGTLGSTKDDIGTTKQLPPTLMAQYYFPIAGTGFTPYVGLGVNYTIFFDENASRNWENGAVDKSKLDFENSWGLAAQMGVDYNINEKWLVNAAVWYIDIDTQGTLTTQLGKVKTDVQIDPWVYMMGVGYKL
jgi:outer membrane protein